MQILGEGAEAVRRIDGVVSRDLQIEYLDVVPTRNVVREVSVARDLAIVDPSRSVVRLAVGGADLVAERRREYARKSDLGLEFLTRIEGACQRSDEGVFVQQGSGVLDLVPAFQSSIHAQQPFDDRVRSLYLGHDVEFGVDPAAGHHFHPCTDVQVQSVGLVGQGRSSHQVFEILRLGSGLCRRAAGEEDVIGFAHPLVVVVSPCHIQGEHQFLDREIKSGRGLYVGIARLVGSVEVRCFEVEVVERPVTRMRTDEHPAGDLVVPQDERKCAGVFLRQAGAVVGKGVVLAAGHLHRHVEIGHEFRSPEHQMFEKMGESRPLRRLVAGPHPIEHIDRRKRREPVAVGNHPQSVPKRIFRIVYHDISC